MIQWKDEDELTPYTPEDTSKILNISPLTLRNWLRAKKIKGVKVGREWRILKKDLEQFLKECHQKDDIFVKEEEKTMEYSKCIEAMGLMTLDKAQRVYATATKSKIENGFTEKFGLTKAPGFENPSLKNISEELWEESQQFSINIPAGDHLEIMEQSGRGMALISHPYGELTLDTLKAIISFCEEKNLSVTISPESWHFPGQTLLIVYTKKDKPLGRPTP